MVSDRMQVSILLSGAEKRTLIPIKYRRCEIPSILTYVALLDYTREDSKPWFWQRLASSIRTYAPQSALLFPFVVGPGYPQYQVPPSLNPTSEYPAQSYPPWLSFEMPVALPGPAAAGPSTAQVHMEMVPVSSHFSEVQSSDVQESFTSESNLAEPDRRESDRRESPPKRHSTKHPLKFLKNKKKS